MKITVHTKELQSVNIKRVIQVSITHTGITSNDDVYNTLQVIYFDQNNIKRKFMLKLSDISTTIILNDITV